MKSYQYFQPNKSGSDYVCGDIHGCFNDLETELSRIGFDKSRDRLFTVGDLTDRGPESLKALDYIKKNWFITVMGNHEDIILKCHYEKTSPVEWHYINGGRWIQKTLPEHLYLYLKEIRNLPLIIQVGTYAIIHSMVPSGKWEEIISMAEKGEEDLVKFILWSRFDSINTTCSGINKIYAGHTIHDEVTNYGDVEDIDTGAFLKYRGWEQGHLTVKKIGE